MDGNGDDHREVCLVDCSQSNAEESGLANSLEDARRHPPTTPRPHALPGNFTQKYATNADVNDRERQPKANSTNG